MTKEARKYNLIQLITGIEDETILQKLEVLLLELGKEDKLLFELSRPTSEKIDLDEIMKEQNFRYPKKGEIDKIILDANVQEPIEDLLRMI